MLPPAPPAFIQSHTPVPTFWAYDRLSADEQRILEASGGEKKYAELAAKSPRLLANFLNQTATLEARHFADGRTALSFVERVERFSYDRSFLIVDPVLHDRVKRDASGLHWLKKSYVGPENSSFFHSEYGECFRENVAWTSQQLAFCPESGYAKLEVDIDEECPLAGEPAAAWAHIVRVGVNHSTPNNGSPMESDAYDITRRLARRGIKPHYHLKFD